MITRPQLLALGVSARTIKRWVASGRLIPVHRGVYAVGHHAPVPFAREMAGFTVARISWRQITERPEAVVARIARGLVG